MAKKRETVKILEDPAQIELFDNPNYLRIVRILRRGELTIKEIHELFNKDYEDKKTLTSIYRYMEKLLEHGLVYVSKEELKRGHLIERYYSRTAQIFLFEDERNQENVALAASGLLQQIYRLNAEDREELTNLFREGVRDLFRCEVDFFEKYGEVIFAQERKHGFHAMKNAVKSFHDLLYLKENPEFFEGIFKILER